MGRFQYFVSQLNYNQNGLLRGFRRKVGGYSSRGSDQHLMLRTIDPQIGFAQLFFKQFAVVVFLARPIEPAGKAHALHRNNSRLIQLFDKFQQTLIEDFFLGFGEGMDRFFQRSRKRTAFGGYFLAFFGQINGIATSVDWIRFFVDQFFYGQQPNGFANRGLGEIELLGQIIDLAFFRGMELYEQQKL